MPNFNFFKPLIPLKSLKLLKPEIRHDLADLNCDAFSDGQDVEKQEAHEKYLAKMIAASEFSDSSSANKLS